MAVGTGPGLRAAAGQPGARYQLPETPKEFGISGGWYYLLSTSLLDAVEFAEDALPLIGRLDRCAGRSPMPSCWPPRMDATAAARAAGVSPTREGPGLAWARTPS